MNKSNITESIHKLPNDMASILKSDSLANNNWQTLTPLARNEWICWVTYVKREETRQKHLKRFNEEMRKGKRRPCCWQGCMHRKGL